jgi:GT2 family glycosyltransferase
MSVDISVLIVNYNGAKFIQACLDSIFASDGDFTFEIIIVDNCSKDDSLGVLKAYGDRIRVIPNQDNRGFSGGNNQGADVATGEFLFLLNNDTVIESTTMGHILSFCRENPKIGAVAPKLLNEDGSLQAPGSMFGTWRFKKTSPVEVPFIAGAAVMMKASVYAEMGGMDENLFFYNDDIDMCKQIQKLGYPIYYLPTAQLVHFGGLSTKFRKIGSLIEGYRGGFYICYKYYGVIAYSIYRILVLVDLLPRLVWHTVGGLFSEHQRTFRDAYLKILWIDITNDIFLVGKERAKQ